MTKAMKRVDLVNYGPVFLMSWRVKLEMFGWKTVKIKDIILLYKSVWNKIW